MFVTMAVQLFSSAWLSCERLLHEVVMGHAQPQGVACVRRVSLCPICSFRE